jgi:hypothetical protein
MTRWKASAIHLVLSILVLSTIAAILVWRWYPPGLFHMANADKLLLIIAGVDVVMGPLLTLIVYKQGKRSLKFDLAVIALLQLAALGYGLNAVWQSRPVYMVAMVDRFRLVFANELDPSDLRQASDRFKSLPWLTVETVAALAPDDPQERQRLLFMTLDTGKDLDRMPKYYAPFDAGAGELLEHSVPSEDFAARLTTDDASKFSAAVHDSRRTYAGMRVSPIISSRGNASMLIDADDGSPLKPVAVDPLPVLSAIHLQEPKK